MMTLQQDTPIRQSQRLKRWTWSMKPNAVVSSSGRRRKVEDKNDCLLSSVLGGTIQCVSNREVQMKFFWECRGSARGDRGQGKTCSQFGTGGSRGLRRRRRRRPLPCCVPEVDLLLKIRCCTPSSRCHAAVVIKLKPPHTSHLYYCYYYCYYYHYYYHD